MTANVADTAKNNEGDEVLFSVKYTMDELSFIEASSLYGNNRFHDAGFAVSLGLMAILVISALAFPDQVMLLGIFVVAVAAASALATNWNKIQEHQLAHSNLASLRQGAYKCTTTMRTDSVTIEDETGDVTTFSLHDLKNVRANENGCLADFGKKRLAYFPAKKMSKKRFGDLIKALDIWMLANNVEKKSSKKSAQRETLAA